MREVKYKYQVTKQKLIDYVGQLPENTPLPNRNVLAQQCGVARVTLERAISELIGEGVLVSMDGKGTYAAAPAVSSPAACLSPSTWAILVYSMTKGTAPMIFRGVEDFTNEHDISLIVCNTDNDPQKEVDYLKKLCSRNVDGIILIPSTHSAPVGEVFDELEEKGISVVACSRQVPGYDFPGTFQNFFQSGFMATQHLLQMGCRRIAYFATSRYSTIEDRLQGYMAAVSQHNFQNADDKAEDPVGLSDITGDIGELFGQKKLFRSIKNQFFHIVFSRCSHRFPSGNSENIGTVYVFLPVLSRKFLKNQKNIEVEECACYDESISRSHNRLRPKESVPRTESVENPSG